MARAVENFSRELLSLEQRWRVVSKEVEKSPEQPSHVLITCLEEMGLALEELRVAEEELLTQNAEILQVNESLANQMQRYKDLFDFAPDGYLETDLYGKILEANRYAVVLFNVEKDHLIGLPIANLIAPEQRRTARHKINRMPTLMRVQHWELSLIRQGAENFEAMLTVQAICDHQGRPEALRWLIRDVTEMKRSQAELQRVKLQNMELAESDRLKQLFLANVSHELRTPLNSIIGFSNILHQQFMAQPDRRQADLVNRIHRSGKNLLQLVHEILDFSQLKGSHFALHPASFDLTELTADVLDELAYLAEQKSLQLQMEVPEYLEVWNDPTRMRQIIVNLVGNAIKFTEHGTVTVHLRTPSSDRVVLAVQDTGIGIAPADQVNIFKEFWQVRQSMHGKSSGLGLGLSIVRAIVRSMGGTIRLESQPRIGTTFYVELPRRVQTDPA